MQLSDFEWKKKDISIWDGSQIVLDFGSYQLSIINDGYGRDRGLYEIAVFESNDGLSGGFARLPSITGVDDDVVGYLSEDDVNGIIKKLYFVTGHTPTQV